MSKTFEYPHLEDNEFTVEREDSGELYRDRPWRNRLAVVAFGLLLALGSVYFVWQFQRRGESLAVVLAPALIGVPAAVGVLAELIVGSDRSAVVERREKYYVEMMPVSRCIVSGLGIMAFFFGLALFQGARNGMSGGSPRSRGLVALVSAIPFGEYLALLAAVVVAFVLLNMSRKGLALVHLVEDGE